MKVTEITAKKHKSGNLYSPAMVVMNVECRLIYTQPTAADV